MLYSKEQLLAAIEERLKTKWHAYYDGIILLKEYYCDAIDNKEYLNWYGSIEEVVDEDYQYNIFISNDEQLDWEGYCTSEALYEYDGSYLVVRSCRS